MPPGIAIYILPPTPGFAPRTPTQRIHRRPSYESILSPGRQEFVLPRPATGNPTSAESTSTMIGHNPKLSNIRPVLHSFQSIPAVPGGALSMTRTFLRRPSNASNKTIETTSTLAIRACNIRKLSKNVSKNGVTLSEAETQDLVEFLEQLGEMELTADMLRFSRIHFALMEMTKTSSWWSAAARRYADCLLIKWGTKFGDLRVLVEDQWGPGGRMEGIQKVRCGGSARDISNRSSRSPSWVIQQPEIPPLKRALESGDLGFEVGSWWIKAAAAFRDGIIHCFDGTTADETQAYAIVVKNGVELDSSTDKCMRIRAALGDVGAKKLPRNLLTKEPVRVLRHYRQSFRLRPERGLRYDGLYKVTQCGVKLETVDGREELRWTFSLERLDEQDGLEKSFGHPTAEEKDDWDEYQRSKHHHTVSVDDVDMKKERQVVAWGSRESSIFGGMESGYFALQNKSGSISGRSGGFFGERGSDFEPSLDSDLLSGGHYPARRDD